MLFKKTPLSEEHAANTWNVTSPHLPHGQLSQHEEEEEEEEEEDDR